MTSAVYRRIRSGNLAAALAPATVAIRDAITRGEDRKRTITNYAWPAGDQIAVRNQAVRYVHDALETFANGIAGAQRGATDRVLLERWMKNVFGMVFDLFEDRQPDVYAAWLRPSPSAPKRLKVSRQRNLPTDYQHYEYVLGEGLVGKVWSQATPAAISELRAHPWWVYREGCDNVTYLAAPVGSSDTTGGVLVIGSDLGFAVEDADLEALVLLADVLALAVDLPIRAGDPPEQASAPEQYAG